MKRFTKKLAVLLSVMCTILSFSSLNINAVSINLNVGSKTTILVENNNILLSENSDIAETELLYGNVYYVYGVGEGTVKLYELDVNYDIVSSYDINVIRNNIKIGDINEDKIVDKYDIEILQLYLTKRISNLYDFETMDIDGDNNVNVFDLIYLERIVAYNIYPGQNIPETTTEPTAATSESNTTTTRITTTKETVKTTVSTTVTTTTTLDEKEKARKYAEEVLELVNQERADVGVSPLKLNDKLFEASMIRADEITELFSHDRPDGSSCFTVLGDFGLSYSYVGENIAAGRSSPSSVVNGWMNSSGHRKNILNENFTELGVGYVYAPNSEYGYYWVQIFRKP